MNANSRRRTTRPLALAALALLALAGPALGAVRDGTSNGETLTGTNKADQITGAGGNDTLKGLAGDDTYHFADGWGLDTLEEKRAYRVGGEKKPGGIDTLSFENVPEGVVVALIPEWRGITPEYSRAVTASGDRIALGGSAVENVVGTRGTDNLYGGGAANRLATGGGPGDNLIDYGGQDGPAGYPDLAPSSDTYADAAANTGTVVVLDSGGAADVLDLRPLRRAEVILREIDTDGAGGKDSLQIVTPTSSESQVVVVGHVGRLADDLVAGAPAGRIETLRFADEEISFGGKADRAGGADDGTALLDRAETRQLRALAERAPGLAEQARERVRALPEPGTPPGERGR